MVTAILTVLVTEGILLKKHSYKGRRKDSTVIYLAERDNKVAPLYHRR